MDKKLSREKLEFLKREEIKTMMKDITRLQEEESKKERERIMQLKTGEELERLKKEEERIKKEQGERITAEEEARRRKEELKKTEGEKKKEEAERLAEEEKKRHLWELERKKSEEETKRKREMEEFRKKETEEERMKRLLEELEEKKLQRMVEGIRIKAREREMLVQTQAEEERKKKEEEERRILEEERKRKTEEEKKKLEEEKRKELLERLEKEETARMAAEIVRRAKEREKEFLKITERMSAAAPSEKILLIPKPPSRLEKVFIRALMVAFLVLVILLVFIFWFWYLTQKKPDAAPTPSATSEITEPEMPKEPEIKMPKNPELFIPSALIQTQTTLTLEISASEELPNKFPDFLNTRQLEKDTFNRLLIANETENKILGLKEFLNAFEAKTPENFYEKLDNNFTLFLYPLENKNRMGFIAKILDPSPVNKASLNSLLRSWEPTLEKDLGSLFSALGKEKPAYSPYFLTKEYEDAVFRYLTFTPSPDFFGICYVIFKDYFIFTTSCDSTLKLLNGL